MVENYKFEKIQKINEGDKNSISTSPRIYIFNGFCSNCCSNSHVGILHKKLGFFTQLIKSNRVIV